METANSKLIFQDDHFVGFVKQVSPKNITVHFPSSPLLKKFYWNAEALQAGIVGNYVLIEGEEHGFLGQIAELSLPEKERMILNQTAFERDDFHPFAKVEILLSFSFYDLKAEKGLTQFPPIGSKVFVCPGNILTRFLKEFGRNKSYPNEPDFEIASLPTHPGTTIKIAPQAIFGRHCAIVGTTGGGKSYTVTKLVEEVIRNNGKAVLFDATGEYNTLAASKRVIYKRFNTTDDNPMFFHYTCLRETDYYALFRPAGQIQLPKLQEAFKSLRLVKCLKTKPELDQTANDKIILNTYVNQNNTLVKENKERNKVLTAINQNPLVSSMTCDLDIKKLSYQVYNECIFEHSNNNQENFGGKSERDLGSCFSLISRINTTINGKDFQNVFGINQDANDENSFNRIYNDFISANDSNVLIIALDKVSSDYNLKSILINCFGRFLLEEAFEKKFNANPLIVFLDEAHLFLNKTIRDEYSIEVDLNAFERIAKECRKFGLFLVLSTQLPRDIPVGILSQFGTFLVHRLINQNDRNTIEFACSEATRNALSFLPTLMPGQVLLTGVDFPMPIILQIKHPDTAPDSKTPQIFKTAMI